MNQVFTFKKLYLAYLDCRKNKRGTVNALDFEWNLEENLFSLLTDLEERSYRVSRSICFVVQEPVPREIFAATFRDRVIHHLLVREIEKVGERQLIFNTFSCRKGKGTHKAVQRLRESVRRLSRNSTEQIYYLQLDLSGFFMSIDHQILFRLVEELVHLENKSFQWKKDVLWLAEVIIFSKPTDDFLVKGDRSLFDLVPSRKSLFSAGEGKGLPIGNYSSQFFANLYLNELDQFVKRKLKCLNYFRYVDDFVILEKDPERLKVVREKIIQFLKDNLKLELNHKKTKLQSVDRGVDFLGYFVKMNYTLVRRRVVNNLLNKLEKEKEDPLPLVNSYFAHFRHANSYNLRKDIVENKLDKVNKNYIIKKDYLYLKKDPKVK